MRRWFKLPDWYLCGWLVPLAWAAVLTAPFVLIYFTTLSVWPWPWAYRREADGTIDLPSVFAAQLAFGQVFTGFITIFLASLFGAYVILEFIEAQKAPDLTLRLRRLGQRDPEADRQQEYVARLTITNLGTRAAIWYALRLTVDFLPRGVPEVIGPEGPVRPHQGRAPENWQHEPVEYVSMASGSAAETRTHFFRLSFASNGTIPILPGQPLNLGEFRLPVAWFGDSPKPKVYTCRYWLSCEGTEPQEGALSLDLYELVEGQPLPCPSRGPV